MRMRIALTAQNVPAAHLTANHAHPAQVVDRNPAVYLLEIVIPAQILDTVVLVKILMIYRFHFKELINI
jgi:hypothetical protein